MTNLENIDSFLLQDDIDTINKFIGDPLAINVDKNAEDVDESTRAFLYRLAKKIKETNTGKICRRECPFRKKEV
jgi:hypothetical protein